MADPEFRRDQHARMRDERVGPINAFVDEIRLVRGWTPYVAPLHAGVDARMLSILRDPGDMTKDDERGSGMLCIENDDQSAEAQAMLAESGGVLASDFVPWNSVPWYINNRKPTTAELHEATPYLVVLLDLLPQLEVVLLQGGEAKLAWSYLRGADPQWMRRGLTVISTYHPSQSALQTPYPDERAARVAHRIAAWKQAGEMLHR